MAIMYEVCVVKEKVGQGQALKKDITMQHTFIIVILSLEPA